MALSGHPWLHRTRPLSREKRTWRSHFEMSAYDPRGTSGWNLLDHSPIAFAPPFADMFTKRGKLGSVACAALQHSLTCLLLQLAVALCSVRAIERVDTGVTGSGSR